MRPTRGFIPKEDQGSVVIDGYVSAGSVTSVPINLDHMMGYSISAKWPSTGTPVGTFTLEASNDLERNTIGEPDSNLTTWVTIAGTSKASSLGSPLIWDMPNAMYRWVRLVYTRSSGSITLTARAQIKG